METIPVKDYQDALNSIPDAIKKAHPSYEWQHSQTGSRMIWMGSKPKYDPTRDRLPDPNDLHIGHPALAKFPFQQQVEFIGRLRDAGLRNKYTVWERQKGEQPMRLEGPNYVNQLGALQLAGSFGKSFKLRKRHRSSADSTNTDASQNRAPVERSTEKGISPTKTQQLPDRPSDDRDRDQLRLSSTGCFGMLSSESRGLKLDPTLLHAINTPKSRIQSLIVFGTITEDVKYGYAD
ncbi:hypothetical protein Dda_6175 [Drechslerella dactyloides]|uniref:Uncharacterized protein n=1 Tax=Drechslerella dactyloides TaxID=74499 RepID=A0AAD6IZA0_DREDA|nr:hypothetical protein Dda_6175 [Drechslerella dactyloides]